MCRSRKWGAHWIQCGLKSQEDREKLEIHQDKNGCDPEELRERVFESCKVVCRALSLFLALLSIATLQEAISARSLGLEVYSETR